MDIISELEVITYLSRGGLDVTEELADLVIDALNECEAGCSDTLLVDLDGLEIEAYDVVVAYDCGQFVERWQE